MSFSAVLFDLDGTLLDTAPDLAGAVNEIRVAHGLAPLPLAELAPMCSFGGRGMLQRGLNLYPGDADYAPTYQQFVDCYAERLTCATTPYPGIRDLVGRLAADGWIWGVVTNKAESLALPLMQAMAFDPAPACVIGGDTAGVPKPDPAPIKLGLERAGAQANGSVYVGDSSRDMAAGRAAGLHTIGVSYGYIPEGESAHGWPAEQIVDTVAELRNAIDAFSRDAVNNSEASS